MSTKASKVQPKAQVKKHRRPSPKADSTPEETQAPSTPLEQPQIIMVPFRTVHLTSRNPRSILSEAEIEELTVSILAHRGILQNFVVRPHPEVSGEYEVAAGGRRHRAFSRLIERGHFSSETLVPVQVRQLDDQDFLVVALAENIARTKMHELDEGETLLQISQGAERGSGATRRIAEALGRTQRWVQTRIALVERLGPGVKQAFRDGAITFEQARSLLPASHDEQEELLANILQGFLLTAEEVGQEITPDLPRLSTALFPLDAYSGPILGEDTAPLTAQFFGDPDLFRNLQEPALAALVAGLEARFEWIEVERDCDDLSLDRRRFAPTTDPDLAGAVVKISRLLEAATYESMFRVERAVPRPPAPRSPAPRPWPPAHGVTDEPPATEETGSGLEAADAHSAEEAEGPGSESLNFTSAHLLAAHQRKTDSLRTALVEQPQHALRLACLALLGERTACLLKTEPPATCDQVQSPSVLEALGRLRSFLPSLAESDVRYFVAHGSGYFDRSQEDTWSSLVALPDQEVLALFAALLAPSCGSFTSYNPVAGDRPTVLRLVQTLEVQHGTFKAEDLEAWLNFYRKGPLLDIAVACGAFTPTDRKRLAKLRLPEIRAAILASPTRNPDWIPPELSFATTEDILAGWNSRAADTSPVTVEAA
jgi:ParB/RepB/Spo0J family partition protein